VSELEAAGDETETVYTAAGKEWQKTRETIEDPDTGEEREVVQIYENGQPRIDYGEDDEIIEEQKERALNAFTTAQSQHAMPVVTAPDESAAGTAEDLEADADESMEPYEDGRENTGHDHGYTALTERLAAIHGDGGSALVVTDQAYEDAIEDALNAEGFEYTVEEAL